MLASFNKWPLLVAMLSPLLIGIAWIVQRTALGSKCHSSYVVVRVLLIILRALLSYDVKRMTLRLCMYVWACVFKIVKASFMGLSLVPSGSALGLA